MVSSPALLSQMYYSTMLANNSAAGVFNTNQAQMGLANSVSGAESPSQIVSLASMDKALAFKGISDANNYLYAQKMQENLLIQQKKEREARNRLLQTGGAMSV